MVNHWYKYYIRNFPVNEADPLTQRLKELHRDEWGEVPNLAKLRHYFYRLDDERDIYGTTAASVIDRKPTPSPPANIVQTDFLNLGSSEGKRVSSLFAPGFDNALQDRLIRQARERGYTALAFYVMNENDGDWANHKKVFNGYTTHRGAVLASNDIARGQSHYHAARHLVAGLRVGHAPRSLAKWPWRPQRGGRMLCNTTLRAERWATCARIGMYWSRVRPRMRERRPDVQGPSAKMRCAGTRLAPPPRSWACR